MARFNPTNAFNTILAVAEAEKVFNEKRPVAYGLVADYQPSLKELLGHEGGYTNDPKDPGGPTNWGITIYDARMYWRVDATPADVKAMPLSVAQTIYKSKYWDAVRGDELPPGVDYCVFDYGVNSGVGRARPLLQKLVGVIPDGKFGPETMAAIAKQCSTHEGRDAIINAYQNARMAFLQSLGTWSHFGKGWGTRVREVRALALKMSATPSVMIPPGSASSGDVKPSLPPKVDRPVQPPLGSPLPPPPPNIFSWGALVWALKTLFGKK